MKYSVLFTEEENRSCIVLALCTMCIDCQAARLPWRRLAHHVRSLSIIEIAGDSYNTHPVICNGLKTMSLTVVVPPQSAYAARDA